MENAYVGFCLYLKRARSYRMPSFVPTLIYTRYTHLFSAYTEWSHFWTLPVIDAFCMFCNSNIKMFITECWQGSVFACIVSGVTGGDIV